MSGTNDSIAAIKVGDPYRGIDIRSLDKEIDELKTTTETHRDLICETYMEQLNHQQDNLKTALVLHHRLDDLRTWAKWNTIVLLVTVLLLSILTACLLLLRHQVQEVADDLERFKTETYDRERSLLSVKLPTISDEPEKAEPLLADLSAETESTVKSAAENVVTEAEISIAPSYDETDYLLRVLTAEGGSSYTMCGCVAQCMLNAYRRGGYTSQIEMLNDYGYTSPASWISDAARQAYDDVWLSGVKYVDVEDALYFYSTRYCYSAWHETMRFITEVDGVRFFGRWE